MKMTRRAKLISIGALVLLVALLVTFLPVKGVSIDSEGMLCIDMNVAVAAQTYVEVQTRDKTGEGYEYTLHSGDKVKVIDPNGVDGGYLRIERWGGECYLEIKAPTDVALPSISLDSNKIAWGTAEYDIHLYTLEPTTVDGNVNNELGGFEYEIILKEKPKSNDIVLDIETEGLVFYYQPPLTQEEIDAGCIRPENVVGSYAVYHATQSNIHESQYEADLYKSGKAFHIYRPKVTDDNGDWIWAGLKVDEKAGTLTITIDNSWLAKAAYPVSIDPNFGYETIGGTSLDYSAWDFAGCKFLAPASGTVTSITMYLIYLGQCDVNYGYYDDNSGAVGDHVAHGTATYGGTGGWVEVSVSGSVTGGNYYWLVGQQEYNQYWIRYDSGASNQGCYHAGHTWEDWGDDPSTSYYAYEFSIYATFTPEIDIGTIDPSGAPRPSGSTLIAVDNPSNATGVITAADIDAYTAMSGVVVGTFYNTGGTDYKCRDSESIGSVSVGIQRFTGLTIDVSTGDYIGIYFTGGTLDYASSGYSGLYYVTGEYIDPNDETTYALGSGHGMGLYGMGYATCSPDISNSPTSYNFGGVGESETHSTGLDYFTVTNNSGGTVDISIQGTNMQTGGVGGGSIKVETFDKSFTNDGETLTLTNDVGDTSDAFVLNLTARRTSAGWTGATTNMNWDDFCAGVRLTDTDELTFYRPSAGTGEIRMFGEVWRYVGSEGGEYEFIKRWSGAVTIASGSSTNTQAVSGVSDVDDVVCFVTGVEGDLALTTDGNRIIATASMTSSSVLEVERGETGTEIIVYVEVVEFTGSGWTIGHWDSGDINSSNSVTATIYPNYDYTGTPITISDWTTAFIWGDMFGDSATNHALEDTWFVVEPNNSTSVLVDLDDTAVCGTARGYVLQCDDLDVERETASKSIPQNLDTSLTDPSNITTADERSIAECYVFTDGGGTAYARGAVSFKLNGATVEAWVHRSGNTGTYRYAGIDLSGLEEAGYVWTLSDTATVGSDIYGMKAGLDGGSYSIIVKLNSPYNDLVTGLSDSGTQDWGLQLLTPSTITDWDEGQMTATVTITATCQ